MAEFNRLTESGTVVKSPEYWARRSEWIEQQVFKDVDKANRRIVNGYNTVLKDIEQDIADHLTKYPNIDERLTLKEYLTAMDSHFNSLNELQKSIKDLTGAEKKIAELKIRMLTDKINNTNTARNITALEMLDQQLRVRLSEFGVGASKQMSNELKQVYEQTYDRKQFTIQRGVGYGYLYRKPDWKAVEKAINYPWAEDGSMWSERIWNYVDMEAKNFVKGVRKAIVSDALLQGKNPSRIAKELVGFANPTLSPSQMKFNLSRLLQTEATHILGEAQAEVSNEWGFTHYTYLATLDERTSPICQSLDGETFAYKDRKTGVNYPPMHPLCRSTVYDVVPDAIYTNRASRDATGKTVQEVPADVTYAQWKEWQKTGVKTWDDRPIIKPMNVSQIVKEILDKNSMLTDQHKKELTKIVNKMTPKEQNLYNKLSNNFSNNAYYNPNTGWYQSFYNRVEMDMNSIGKEVEGKTGRTGAFITKFHEEFHQLDHILANSGSPFTELTTEGSKVLIAERMKITSPYTKVGAKMSEAIEQDIINNLNKSVDHYNKLTGEKVKHINTLNKIPTKVKTALQYYLEDNYGNKKVEATIFTDAVGLHTESRLSPYDFGWYGHKPDYNKKKGKAGATSESWATYGAFKIGDNSEGMEVFKELMPNTAKVYDEVFEQVLEYAETNDITY